MNKLEQFRETAALYRKHGWRLERVLMRGDTLAQLHDVAGGEAHSKMRRAHESQVDAMWFARASAEGAKRGNCVL